MRSSHLGCFSIQVSATQPGAGPTPHHRLGAAATPPHSLQSLRAQTREKRVYTTTVGPLFSRSVARPRGHRAKKTMVYTIFLGKQGKRVYTIGPERRVCTIEPQTRKKKKRRVSTVVVYTFFFPAKEIEKITISGLKFP